MAEDADKVVFGVLSKSTINLVYSTIPSRCSEYFHVILIRIWFTDILLLE